MLKRHLTAGTQDLRHHHYSSTITISYHSTKLRATRSLFIGVLTKISWKTGARSGRKIP